MKVIAAYMLAVLGGKANPAASDIKSILSSVGADADDASINTLLGELKGKDVFKVIEEGKAKLASVPTGGAAAPAPVEAKKDEKKDDKKDAKKDDKKKKEEPVEDDGGDMGFGSLF